MPEPIKIAGKALWTVSLYTLSIPERYLRGLTALTGDAERDNRFSRPRFCTRY